jgi:protein-S-isoprenylcysteine O-methyltransferase Ste14
VTCPGHDVAEAPPCLIVRARPVGCFDHDSVCAFGRVGSALDRGAVSWSVACADELTVNVLYVRAVVALALPALVDVVVPAWLVSFPAGRIDIGATRFVVRGGAYRVVRNPMYLANVAIVVESGLLFQSWFVFVRAAILFGAFHLFVITYEEPTLTRLFGDDYETYRRHVGRWIPQLPRRETRAP